MTRVLALAATVLALAGCDQVQPAASGRMRCQITVGAAQASVEVAATPAERAAGLSNRRSLGENEGMLFMFPEARPVSFWMKDTFVPLSIAFITPAGRIAEILDMEPLTETPHESREAVTMALEMPRGWFAAHGVAVGDTVSVPEEISRVEPQ